MIRTDLPPAYWILLAVGLGGWLGANVGLWQLWQNRTRFWDRPGAWWGYGEYAWRTLVRFLPTSQLLLGWLIVVYFSLAFDRRGPLAGLADFILDSFLVLVFLLFTMPVLMYVFEQPKFLMPPHLRESRPPRRS